MTTASDFFATGLEQVRKSWSWFLVLGIMLIVLGVVCGGRAQTATTFSILLLGWILAISGVLWLVNAFRVFSWHGFFLFLLNANIWGATGYLPLRHPDAGRHCPPKLGGKRRRRRLSLDCARYHRHVGTMTGLSAFGS